MNEDIEIIFFLKNETLLVLFRKSYMGKYKTGG